MPRRSASSVACRRSREDVRHDGEGIEAIEDPARAGVVERATRGDSHEGEGLLAVARVRKAVDDLSRADEAAAAAPSSRALPLDHGEAASKVTRMVPAGTSNGRAAARLRTPLCEKLGIEYPVMLAGMGGVSMAPLSRRCRTPAAWGSWARRTSRPTISGPRSGRRKALTTKPFAVDLLAPLPQMILPYLAGALRRGRDDLRRRPRGAREAVPEMKRNGLTIMVMTGKSRIATRAEAAGGRHRRGAGARGGAATPARIGTLAARATGRRRREDPGSSRPAASSTGAGWSRRSRSARRPRSSARASSRRPSDGPLRPIARPSRRRSRTRRSVRALLLGKPLRSLRNPYILEHEADPSKIKRFPGAAHDLQPARRDGVLGPRRPRAHVHAGRAGRGLIPWHPAGGRGLPRDRGRARCACSRRASRPRLSSGQRQRVTGRLVAALPRPAGSLLSCAALRPAGGRGRRAVGMPSRPRCRPSGTASS